MLLSSFAMIVVLLESKKSHSAVSDNTYLNHLLEQVSPVGTRHPVVVHSATLFSGSAIENPAEHST